MVEAHVTGHNQSGLECQVNNVRGFMPASQISTFRVEDLEQFVDQKLQCVVVEADPSRRNLILSHRAVLEREKESARKKLLEELEVGQTREGHVARIQDFGAFIDLGGVDGLVHISKLSWDRVHHPSEVLQEGQKVRVRSTKLMRQQEKLVCHYETQPRIPGIKSKPRSRWDRSSAAAFLVWPNSVPSSVFRQGLRA